MLMFKKTVFVAAVVNRPLAWVLLALIPLTGPVLATDEPGFYERKAEGWFWYQDPLSAPEPTKAPAPPPAPAVPTPPATSPAPFTVDWVRRELPKALDRAWDDPSPQNIRHFFILQQFVMNRAEQFRHSAQQVVTGDPWLDETSRRPLGAETGRVVNERAGKARHELLATLSQRAGLWFFYRSGCPYCEGQAVVMEVMRHHYGFTVIAVALDGQPLGNGLFPDYQHDRGQARQLQVQTVPATFLVSPAGRFSAISQGELALNEMQSRILVAALREGWVRQDEYDRTRPVLKPTPAPAVGRTALSPDTGHWSERDWAEFLKQAQ